MFIIDYFSIGALSVNLPVAKKSTSSYVMPSGMGMDFVVVLIEIKYK